MTESIYKNPIMLNQAVHKSVKVSRLKNFKFAQDMNSVLVSGGEFREAAKYFPIIFVRDKNSNDILPIAILGLRNKGNLFVDNEGKWKEGVHVPSFFRRYPFILADNENEEGAYTVSVDSDYEGFDSEDGIALFDEEGKQTKELDNIIEFLKGYQANSLLTQEFIKKIDEFGLLKEFYANITMPEGEKLGFTGMLMVNEKALMELEDEKALELYRRGFLAWIYAHLYSLSNFQPLARFTIDESKENAEETAV
ncbi:MAG: SapC family protein [Deltaproteobacteria bacterium]|nr:SapC family protein [Deltaproteobacteria bacterium]